MKDAYNQRGSWRPLVLEVQKHPELGGAFYAREMLKYCRTALATAGGSTSAGSATQESAAANWAVSARCSEFVESDYEQLPVLSKNPSDPLLLAASSMYAAREKFAKTGAADDLVNALNSVFGQGDPLLIDSLGLRLVTYKDPGSGRPQFFFDGRTYPMGQSPDLGLSVLLLPCKLGMRCDESEPRAQLRCISGAGCEGGRLAEVQAQLQDRPGEFEKVTEIADAMAAAIKRNDVTPFMPR